MRASAVKICGLTRPPDARLADRLGASYLGVVLSAGFARSVTPSRAPEVLEGTRADRVAVLVDEPPARGAELARAIGAAVVQLHGAESPEDVRALTALGPWLVWKAVRVRNGEDVERAVLDYRGAADAILLEGWKEGVVGGSGARLPVDGSTVRRHFANGPKLVLAGGLTPENVGQAVRAYGPDVVDVSSGIEARTGQKDERRLAEFIRAATGAAAVPVRAPRGA